MITKRIKAILILLLIISPILLFSPIMVFASDPVYIGNTSHWNGTGSNVNKDLYYANSRYWIFYANGSHMGYRSSLDGVTWSSFTIIRSGAESGDDFDTCMDYDSNRMHYAFANGSAGGNIYYRSGVLESSGSITWDSSESTLGATGTYRRSPIIELDIDKKPWIIFEAYSVGEYRIYIARSSSTTSPWVNFNPSIFPNLIYIGGAMSSVAKTFQILNLGYNAGGSHPAMYFIMGGINTLVYGCLYSGNGVLNGFDNPVVISDNTVKGNGFSAVRGPTNETSYLIYAQNDNEDLYLVNYTKSIDSWGSDVNVYETSEEIRPSAIQTEFNRSYFVWSEPTSFKYAILNHLDDSFTVETLFVDTDFPSEYAFQTYPQIMNSRFGLLFETGSSDPYSVYFYERNVYEDLFVAYTLDADFDPIIFTNKYYEYIAYVRLNQTVQSKSIDTIRLKFYEGMGHPIEVQYDNITDTFSLLSSSDYASLSTGSFATSTSTEDYNEVRAHFLISLSRNCMDKEGVSLYLWANATNGITYPYQVVNASHFDIYNLGGITRSSLSGNASKIAGGDTFEMWAKNSSWININQTFYHLEHYHAQFAIQLLDEGGNGEDELWQDFDHGPLEIHTDSQDWILEIYWSYFDAVNKEFVKGMSVKLFMQEGDQGTDDHWTSINASWYDYQNNLIKSDIVNCFIENEPRAQIRLWLDLWFNKVNASTVSGGRVSAYYYGMRKTVSFLWAGDWYPFLSNSTESMFFTQNRDYLGNITSSMNLELVTVGMNLSRPHTAWGQDDFTVKILNFDISEFSIASSDQVRGVDTPIRVDTRVPDMEPSGFLAPLYSAIMRLANWIWEAFSYLGQLIWDGLASQFPWFTSFWESMTNAIQTLGEFFVTLWNYILSFLQFLYSIFQYVTIPIQILTDAFTMLQNAFGWITGEQLSAFIVVLIIMFFTVPIIAHISRGDFGYPINLAKTSWGVANNIVDWAYRLITYVVSTILNLLRG